MTDNTNLPAAVADKSPGAIANAGMRPGGVIGALTPQSLDDAFRLAKALSQAGDMVPRHFQGKPEMTMAAIVRGMEIGLAPMQALSNIAVINGRASVWGDALPALMQRAGHSIDVEVTGEGEDWVATATLTRGDTGQVVVRSFSVEDAKKAGLWGKQGPWQQYPKRMLSNRARAWAARDGAADALMGLQVAEETSDYQPIKDITPPASPAFAEKIARARALADTRTEGNNVSTDGEILPDDEPETSYEPTFDEDAADPFSEAYDEGLKASQAGMKEKMNPHEPGTADWNNWIGGFRFHADHKSAAEDEA